MRGENRPDTPTHASASPAKKNNLFRRRERPQVARRDPTQLPTRRMRSRCGSAARAGEHAASSCLAFGLRPDLARRRPMFAVASEKIKASKRYNIGRSAHATPMQPTSRVMVAVSAEHARGLEGAPRLADAAGSRCPTAYRVDMAVEVRVAASSTRISREAPFPRSRDILIERRGGRAFRIVNFAAGFRKQPTELQASMQQVGEDTQ